MASIKKAKTEAPGPLKVEECGFGTLDDGQTVTRYELSNGSMKASFISYGATLTSVQMKDKEGKVEEVTLCLPDLPSLLTKNMYYGSTVGRVANRVANGTFTIEDKTYKLSVNQAPNHLHGGSKGLDKVLWVGKAKVEEESVGVTFTYTSPDGEEGYPGNLNLEVTYSLTLSNHLDMDFKAESDAPTPVALTNHAYWNLSGDFKSKVTSHTLRVQANRYVVLGEHMIPTGELRAVEGTPMDFSKEALLGDRIPQVDGGGQPGVDHCYVVEGYTPLSPECDPRASARLMATLKDPASGRAMDVVGTQPGIQVYSANFLSIDEGDWPYVQHNGVCLETEFFPNAVNHTDFGQDIIIQPGKPYRHFTSHHFYLVRE